ncbi:cell division protein ZapA [Pseudomonas agarici]|uniref:Cell division protein ZapA n=1 Tax=Pseudomonas agarici TaxID=46677 RepID=A0A0X8F5I9_PSEAA|nr:cell division protein ZapA [Pseudomonas agarici]AMB83855.1 cell division protein ZapA [Pseudomonas agarici]NWB93381.1 cell division protein ZapA [Pseudomonas agarici]NWC10024.1 cell division protein ZapA [Pseudomonas agarici]SEL53541.1 Cell division protein ZapA, inhibits GTPase activity of FtsZ [Pseudomonas agarici]
MIASADGVTVISILGEEYSIKAPAGQEQTLQDATLMLKTALVDTKKRFPTLIGEPLLVLAALNLCSQQLEARRQHREELDRYQEQVSATVEAISKTIGQS